MIPGRLILPLLILFVKATTSLAQPDCTSIISGRVVDDSGTAVMGATVGIPGSAWGTSTDEGGNFKLDKICRGNQTLLAHSLGFQDYIQRIKVSDDSLFITIILTPLTEQLKEVVVQDHHDMTDHAQNYSVLTEAQLAEKAGKSLGESLREITGVNTIQSGPGIFKPVIHGVHSQRILILNDGVRQEGQQWGAEHAPEIDPFVATNIVVIKDASSIKYGTDALGGVILVNPPGLPDKPGVSGTVNSVLQSNGRSATVSALLEGGIPRHAGWGWRVQGTAKGAGDFHTPDYSLTNTGIRELNYSAATGYHKDNFGVDVYFSHFGTEVGILRGTAVNNVEDLEDAMGREVPLYTAPFSYDIDEPRQEVQHDLVKLNAHLKSGKSEWRLQYGFQSNRRKEFDFRIGELSEVPVLNLKLTTHTVETEFETNLTETNTLCLGVTGMFQKNSSIAGIQRIPFIPNFSNTSGGAYAVTKLVYNKFTVDLGARYDYRYYSVSGYDYKNSLFQSTSLFHNASATAGATIPLNANQAIRLNLSSSWRPPSVAELYSLGTHQSAASIEYGLLLDPETNEVLDINNVNFKTEQALKWVGTYQHRWNNWELEVSPYFNYILNYIYLRPDGLAQSLRGPAPAFRYTQTDASFAGVDFSARWSMTQHLIVSPKASLIRAKDQTKDDYLVFIPPNRYEVFVRYEHNQSTPGNFFFEAGVRYVDKQRRAPRTIPPGEFLDASDTGSDPLNGTDDNFDFMDAPSAYALLSASAGTSLKTENVRYDFRIASENLLNTSYREYTNRFRYFADEIGRNFLLSIKCIF